MGRVPPGFFDRFGQKSSSRNRSRFFKYAVSFDKLFRMWYNTITKMRKGMAPSSRHSDRIGQKPRRVTMNLNPVFNQLTDKLCADYQMPRKAAEKKIKMIRLRCFQYGSKEGFEYFQKTTGVLSLLHYRTFMS